MAMQFVLGDDEPPQKWMKPWPYAEWRAAVLKDETMDDEEKLQRLYAEQWEPVELYKVLLFKRYFNSQGRTKKSRQVVLDRATVDQRIAKAIWVECQRIIARRLTPDARLHICELRDRMEKAAGIEVTRVRDAF